VENGDLLDPPIEKACYYLEEKHATKSCVARNSERLNFEHANRLIVISVSALSRATF